MVETDDANDWVNIQDPVKSMFNLLTKAVQKNANDLRNFASQDRFFCKQQSSDKALVVTLENKMNQMSKQMLRMNDLIMHQSMAISDLNTRVEKIL